MSQGCVPAPLTCIPCTRYKPVEGQELVTLSAENVEAAWSQSKDNSLTVWCNGTEVSDGYRGQPPSLPSCLPFLATSTGLWLSREASNLMKGREAKSEWRGEAELMSLALLQIKKTKRLCPHQLVSCLGRGVCTRQQTRGVTAGGNAWGDGTKPCCSSVQL